MKHEFNPPSFEVYQAANGRIAIEDGAEDVVMIGVEQSELLVKFIRLVAQEIEDRDDVPECDNG